MVSRTEDGQTEFRFFRPEALAVYLVAEFNGWHRSMEPMVRQHDDHWVCYLELPDGVYQFRYLADGTWYNDYAAFGLIRGPHGWNSVVCVDPAPPRNEEARHEDRFARELVAVPG